MLLCIILFNYIVLRLCVVTIFALLSLQKYAPTLLNIHSFLQICNLSEVMVAVAAKMCANAIYIYSFLQICNLSEVMVAVAAKMRANAIYTSLVYNMQPLRGWVISSRNTL